jgi:hypothetical protein
VADAMRAYWERDVLTFRGSPRSGRAGPPGVPSGVNPSGIPAHSGGRVDYLEEIVANGAYVEGAIDESIGKLRVVAR